MQLSCWVWQGPLCRLLYCASVRNEQQLFEHEERQGSSRKPMADIFRPPSGGVLSAGRPGVAAMHGAVFFRRHHALAIRSDIQALPVKIIPLPLRLAHPWSIDTLTW